MWKSCPGHGPFILPDAANVDHEWGSHRFSFVRTRLWQPLELVQLSQRQCFAPPSVSGRTRFFRRGHCQFRNRWQPQAVQDCRYWNLKETLSNVWQRVKKIKTLTVRPSMKSVFKWGDKRTVRKYVCNAFHLDICVLTAKYMRRKATYLAREKRKMGLVSVPAAYLQTRSSSSRLSPPDIRRTCFSGGMQHDLKNDHIF